MNTFLTIIGAIIIFSVIIFVHELGHFLSARLFGVTIHEFSIGMGPAIVQKRKGDETVYSLRAIPVGGYCSLAGENDDEDIPGSFSKKRPLPRIIILAAGAFMNLALGFLIVLSLTAISAVSNGGMPSTVVESVDPRASAAEFLQPGDRIVEVNGNRINIRRDLTFELSRTNGEETTITFKRNGEKITRTFTPMEIRYDDGTQGYIVGFNIAMNPVSPWQILREGFYQTIWMVKLVFISIGMLFEGQAGVGDLSGPVGVVHAMNTVAQSGWYNLLFFAAFLAVNIGVMNLLPLPALDGGRILFVLIELIFGKPVPRDKEGLIHFLGFALLLILMAYATWNDIIRIFNS